MATPPKPGSRASEAIIARLHNLHPKMIDLSLDRLKTLLKKLGNPERKLSPVIHVGGTNGKGSTSAITRAVAEAAGFKVHVYISPHLVHFHERIRLAGQLIDEEMLGHLLSEVEAVNDGAPITFFEITTAVAFLAFSRVPSDLVILEVGLGGRMDATNVIQNPLASMITPIGLDHQHYLGNSLSAIAFEKAGIFKKNCLAISAPQHPDVQSVLIEQAKAKSAPLLLGGRDWRVAPIKSGDAVNDGFLYEDDLGRLKLPLPSLKGGHQIINAGVALAGLRHQKALSIPKAALKAGLGWVRWPARLQSLLGSSLSEGLPEGSRLYLDGAHNPAAAEILRDFLRSFDPIHEPISLIVGMMARKDIKGFMKPLAGLAPRLIAVPVPSEEASAPPSDIALAASEAGISAVMAASVDAALERIKLDHKTGQKPVILICGSLYLAGKILDSIGWPPQ